MSDEKRVPRYEIIVAEGGGESVYQHSDGWWCAADDVARLEAENARLREALAKYGDDSRDTIDGLTEENERLRELLATARDALRNGPGPALEEA